MIESFADKITAQLFEGLAVKRVEAGLQKQALRRLRYIDAATQLDDLRAPPSNRLEALSGDRKGFRRRISGLSLGGRYERTD